MFKLGGSLLDLPDLYTRLQEVIPSKANKRAVLLTGGGKAADVVRTFDTIHHLDEESGHWLAIHAMRLNTYIIESKLKNTVIVANESQCANAWRTKRLPLIDPFVWLSEEHAHGIETPHRWTFTSDSIAAHLAKRLRAKRLILLKSTIPQTPSDMKQAAANGIVDADFPGASKSIPSIELVNLRSQPIARYTIR